MSMFGNNIWATGEINPANFAANTNVNQASRAEQNNSNNTVTDSFVGSPLATNSPSYPVLNLGMTYNEVPNQIKIISAIGSIVTTGLLMEAFVWGSGKEIGGKKLISLVTGGLASIPISKQLAEGRLPKGE